MKPFYYPIILILFSGLFSLMVFAQTSGRITFVKGQSSAIVKGVVRGSTKDADSSCNDYLIRAKAGQTLKAKVTAKAFLLIQSPSNAAVDEGITDSTSKLEESGDYKIQVCNSTPRKLSYTLTASVK
jgi:hypothetical protein